MIDINYELYKVFYHVASTLNFSEASKRLFISQSAVSQSIKTLERKLDQTLFIRSTKKVHLTPEGEILMRHIEPAMNLIHKGETQLLAEHRSIIEAIESHDKEKATAITGQHINNQVDTVVGTLRHRDEE